MKTHVEGPGPGVSSGFSLIEVAIALAVLSVALLGTSTMIISTIRANDVNGQQAAAMFLAQDFLENLKKLPATSDALKAGTHWDTGSLPLGQTKHSDGQASQTKALNTALGLRDSSRTWTVADDPAGKALKTVTVTVQWTSNGKARAVNIATLLAP